MSASYDHIIIGAGHNGLVCAALLARRGRSVLVLEAANEVGGMAVTREFAPGFKVSACAHFLDALPKALIDSLALETHGLRFAARDLATCALNLDGAPVILAKGKVDGVSVEDQNAYTRFRARMSRFTRVMGEAMEMEPFDVSLPSWRERSAALKLGWKLRTLGQRDMREFMRIVGMNAYDLLTETFDSTLLRGALALDASLGAEYAARSPGTVLTLLYRLANEERAGLSGAAQPLGGLGAVTAALAAAARAAGADIRTGARVARISVQGDRATGVVLESGETITAGSVISNADPKTTFLKLLGPEHLDTDFVRRIDHFRARGLVAKLHLALDALPSFRGVDAITQAGRLLISPSMDYLELAYNPSKYREIPDKPALEISLPSINDPDLAPKGQHVLSANVLFVPYDLGPDPTEARSRLMHNVLATLEAYAPGIGQHILFGELRTPLDLEREFNVSGGHWHHGALAFDQFFFTRPVPQAAKYATPLPGLYLCGAGSHPGGGVAGVAGQNAARKVLEGES